MYKWCYQLYYMGHKRDIFYAMESIPFYYFFYLVFWNKRSIACSKVQYKLWRGGERRRRKVIELSCLKLTQLSCNSDSSTSDSVWSLVLFRVRLSFPWPESQLLETGDLRSTDSTSLQSFCLSSEDWWWLLSMTGWINTVLLWQYNTLGFFCVWM